MLGIRRTLYAARCASSYARDGPRASCMMAPCIWLPSQTLWTRAAARTDSGFPYDDDFDTCGTTCPAAGHASAPVLRRDRVRAVRACRRRVAGIGRDTHVEWRRV